MLHLVLAAVALATAPYRLDSPAQVLVMKDGALLVAERGTHDRLLRVNPATGTTTVYATGLGEPWGLGYARDGSILASAANGLYRVRPRKKIASLELSPFAVLADGRVAYANRTSVGVIVGGKAHPWPLSVSAPHGLSLLPDGTLALGDTGNNRILRIDPGNGASTVLTDKVSTALGVAAEPSGSVLTVEYNSGRLLRVAPDGTVSVVASGLRKPYALARTRGGTVYVTQSGDDFQPTGSIARVTPDGRVSTIPLRLVTPARKVAQDYILGIALAPDGRLYASENKFGSEETTLVRLRGRTREVLGKFRGVHGILVTGDRLILGEAYAGRVLRFDPATKTTEVLASGLGNPGFAIPAAAGGWFVSEFLGNRVSHLWPGGHVSTVATVSQPGPIAFDNRHRIVGVTLGGTVFRIERGRARTIY